VAWWGAACRGAKRRWEEAACARLVDVDVEALVGAGSLGKILEDQHIRNTEKRIRKKVKQKIKK
jgi:hypothetical protein